MPLQKRLLFHNNLIKDSPFQLKNHRSKLPNKNPEKNIREITITRFPFTIFELQKLLQEKLTKTKVKSAQILFHLTTKFHTEFRKNFCNCSVFMGWDSFIQFEEQKPAPDFQESDKIL